MEIDETDGKYGHTYRLKKIDEISAINKINISNKLRTDVVKRNQK